MTDLNALNSLGETIARMNPDVGAARNAYLSQIEDVMITLPSGVGANQRQIAMRGWNIGAAESNGHTVAGPGQDAVKLEAAQDPVMGGFIADQAFVAARLYIYSLMSAGRILLVTGAEATLPPDRLAQIDALASRGHQMTASIPAVLSASQANPSDAWQKGFMVATAFCQGNSLPGPGQTAMKTDLMNLYGYATTAGRDVANGFDVGQAVQFGITRARMNGTALSANPGVAAGQLAINGIANQPGISPDQKAAVAGAIAGSSAAAAAGAQSAVAANKPGIIKRFFQFLGLA